MFPSEEIPAKNNNICYRFIDSDDVVRGRDNNRGRDPEYVIITEALRGCCECEDVEELEDDSEEE